MRAVDLNPSLGWIETAFQRPWLEFLDANTIRFRVPFARVNRPIRPTKNSNPFIYRFTLNFTLNFTSSRIDIPSFSDKFSTSPFRVSTSYPIVRSLSSPLLFFFFSFYHDNWTILTKTCNNVQIIVVVARAGEIFFDFTLSFHSPLSDISRSASCTPLSSIISFYRSRDKFYTSIFTRKFLFPRDLLLFLSQCSILHGLAGIFNAV